MAKRRRDLNVDVCGNGNSDGGGRFLFLIDCFGCCPRLSDLYIILKIINDEIKWCLIKLMYLVTYWIKVISPENSLSHIIIINLTNYISVYSIYK